MPGEVRGILVMRLGTSVSEKMRNEFHTAIEETCQAMGIKHAVEDRRESEGWTRSICMVSPGGFNSGVEAVQWAKEMACQIAERVHSRKALTSKKYCGVWIHLEEAPGQEATAMQEESGEEVEEDDEQEGEDHKELEEEMEERDGEEGEELF